MARMNLTSLAAGGLLAGLAALSCAPVMPAAQSQTDVQADSSFLHEAASGGMMEVKLGRMAAQKAASPAVKQFGHRMVTDHSASNKKLMALAARSGFTLDTTLTSEQQQTMSRLQGMSGQAFDRAYMTDMVQDHTKDVQTFKQEATSAQWPPR
jgi:putative membrane protein